jgi:Ser/Thr protein kinase RdoA (MazF antagonist)
MRASREVGRKSASLVAAAERVLGLRIGPEAVRPISDHPANRAFVVDTADGAVIAKLRNADAGDSLEPGTELAIARSVAAAGLGPQPLGSDPDTGITITEFVEYATPWTAIQARESRNIERIAEMLRGLHSLSIDIRPFDAVGWARQYLDAAGRIREAADRQLADELLDRVTTLPAIEYRSLCHNDLVAANVLDTGRLWLIDFEYASAGSPIVDLASFAAMNGLDQQQQERLLTAYHRDQPWAAEFAAFEDFVRVQTLLAHFWLLARRRRVL